ncbi:hypothetical protein [Desulfosarcina ovata]|uniref:Uncharacterized protein n=1 Tax=Desulfosarcina ovata subsp. ovata TaxID=2752305 RepID=A0A5K8AD88_9BACT|nr:hypothetical protein [Desulfosarcina ovata]BBO90527.1 hypothetical protein DSCOOX_37070 [Desulfosarcina ovata subsp. ovata]
MSDHKEGGCQEAVSPGTEETGRQGAPAGFPGMTGEGPGAMNAYDIPRYNTQGYVQGRPGTPNDPTSAGGIQGAPAGDAGRSMGDGSAGPAYFSHGQPEPGTMGAGTMNMAYGPAMPGYGPTGQPGVQPPPQGMGYGGMDAAYGPAMSGYAPTGQPGVQPPPQGMGYGGMDAAYGPAMPGYAPTGQPGVQPPPQGMGYGGMDAAYGPAIPGYGPTEQPGIQPPPGQSGAGGGIEQYGRIAEVVKDMANGEPPDVNKLAAVYSGFDAQFWKGALIGAVLSVLLTSETVRTAVAGTMGGIMGAFKKSDQPAGDAT